MQFLVGKALDRPYGSRAGILRSMLGGGRALRRIGQALRARFRRLPWFERRWIPEPEERNTHEAVVRDRLATRPTAAPGTAASERTQAPEEPDPADSEHA
jgi:hypothetical protein